MSTKQRDLIGYGNKKPNPSWPNEAKLAVQFVLNYEEGGEYCLLNGDSHSENYLWEIVGAEKVYDSRNMNIESVYEYGSRAGVWRILELFRKYNIKITIYSVARALEQNHHLVEILKNDGHEIATHGYRWIDYQDYNVKTEREHLLKAIDIQKKITGYRPLGSYIGRISPNTRRIIAEEGGFIYNSDVYNDDLPYWEYYGDKALLLIPYTLDNNDMRFCTAQGFNTGNDFFEYLKSSFNVLYEEGQTSPKMMSIGLHCRIIGRPGRFESLVKFVNYISNFKDIWVTRRIDIAKHWEKKHPKN